MKNPILRSRGGLTALILTFPLGVTSCHGGEVVFGFDRVMAVGGQGGVAGNPAADSGTLPLEVAGCDGLDPTACNSAGLAGAGPGGLASMAGAGAGGLAGMAGAGPVEVSGMAGAGPLPPCSMVTSAENAYWVTSSACNEVSSDTVEIAVDERDTAQIWEGFGGAFSERGWSLLTVNGLEGEALHLLFGKDGCRFVFGRVPIGASDFSIDRFTLDEYAGDLALEHFSIARDRQRMIPYVKAALAINPRLRIWASPWTPPTWMKNLRPLSEASPYDGGTLQDDDSILDAYARYLLKFVSEYAAEGISIETLSPQNEPSYEQNYPSCRWSVALYTKFIGEYLGPTFASASSSTKLMLGTLSNGAKDYDYLTSVMDDPKASSYISVAGLQWDMLKFATTVRSQLQNIPTWQTEHKCGNYSWNLPTYQRTAPNDHAYAIESWGQIRDWIKAGVTAYNAWNMVLDEMGLSLDSKTPWAQNSLLVVDGGGRLIKTPAYYVFRHVAQFVDPGAQVLGSLGGDTLAFRNPDGAFVLVLYNKYSERQSILGVGGKKFAVTMPSNGWATVQIRP